MLMKKEADSLGYKAELESDTVVPQEFKSWLIRKGFLVKDPTGVAGK